jgi:hypothetical protein
MAAVGLQFIRRRESAGFDYFIVNRSGHSIDRWVELGTKAASAVLLDPLFPNRGGLAAIKTAPSGATEIYLQLEEGQSLVVRTSLRGSMTGRPWLYAAPAKAGAMTIAGPWQVHFLEGGPVLPDDYTEADLSSWANRDDVEARRFAGTARFRAEFTLPPGQEADWRLDLGRVCESARVHINGREVATLWVPPFSVRVGPYLRPGRNVLEVDVTNLPANRIADMDRRHVPWKIFHDINVVFVQERPFDASDWPQRDSGLIGPVTLSPIVPATL